MKRIQINHNVIDMELLKEIKFSLIGVEKWLFSIFLGIAFWAFGFYQMYESDFVTGIIFLVVGGFCIGWTCYSHVVRYHNMTEIFQDTDSITYTLIFNNAGLSVKNCYSGHNTMIPYDQMKRLKETKHTLTIFAKNDQFAMIKKDCLKVSQQELIAFLKTKGTHIRRWPKG